MQYSLSWIKVRVEFPFFFLEKSWLTGLDHETRDNITQESLYSEQWKQNQPKSQSYHEICAEHAIKQARAIGEKSGGMYALITGNTTLVGEALSFLGYDFHSGVSR
jgi:hypothetical protein